MVNGSEEKLNSLIISFFLLFFLVVQERTAGGLVSVTRVKYYAPDKEERMERGKKIDLLLQENIRREKEKKEAEKRRQQKEEILPGDVKRSNKTLMSTNSLWTAHKHRFQQCTKHVSH